MTGKQLRALALSLPEAVEKPHMQRTSFRLRDKIFLTMSADETHAALKIPSREYRYRLIAEQPDAFEDLGGWTRMGFVGIRLPRVERALMHELVIAAWRRIAPKRALAAYDARAPR